MIQINKINWKLSQEKSDDILADGLMLLLGCKTCNSATIRYSGYGNYLITHNGKPCYIGEAKNVKARIRQQFNEKTSTFYKNYHSYLKNNPTEKTIAISEYEVCYMDTAIGRKEIEDFGIVNLPTYLNRFQIGKRTRSAIKSHKIWEDVQNSKESVLGQAETEIFKQTFLPWLESDPEDVAGLYIVQTRKGDIIYIGESSSIKERFNTHNAQTYFSALRRHIGTEILGYELKEKNGKKKYLEVNEDDAVTKFLRSTNAIFFPVAFGRYEFEEYLIKKYKPILNRKDNLKG